MVKKKSMQADRVSYGCPDKGGPILMDTDETPTEAGPPVEEVQSVDIETIQGLSSATSWAFLADN